MAQSSVTIFGLMDAGVTYVSNSGGHSNTLFDDGNFYPNLLGFRGREDLGAGTRAVFELVSQYSLANGSTIPGAGAIFNRTALVGLESDRLGKLTLGTQYDFMTSELLEYDSAYYIGGFYDFRQGPFAALGVPNNPTGSWDFDRVGGSSRVASSVKYKSVDYDGLTFGAMYGFGNVAGSFSANNTVSAGMQYVTGSFGIAAAYTEVKYAQLDNGHDGIRNWGIGTRYDFGKVLVNLLYTNTRNTLTGGQVSAYQAGVNWHFEPAWSIGANYQFMKGNAQLSDNKAHEVTATLMYSLSKRTSVYAEGIYQHAIGGNGPVGAWINGLFVPSSSPNQMLGRVGIATMF
jgi:predicted porin